jgi:hypothetical protein
MRGSCANPIQRSILDGFADVVDGDGAAAVEVGDDAGDLRDARVGTQGQPVIATSSRPSPSLFDLAVGVELARPICASQKIWLPAEALKLQFAPPIQAFADSGGWV